MKRRQFLQGMTAAAAVPMLGACAGDGSVVEIDRSYPVGHRRGNDPGLSDLITQ